MGRHFAQIALFWTPDAQSYVGLGQLYVDDPRFTATQYALFTSLAAVPRTVVNASTGWIVEQTGWFAFFLLCMLLALPGMALLLRVAPWNADKSPP